ncbi:hypothetical protein IMAU20013_02018 [Lactiplantibacillus plantarum]|nr:hypothetical protein [Lactiplantibacillus plantarum]MCG0881588.1 hypothetical protein [Lactiplantibacillus plantarum]
MLKFVSRVLIISLLETGALYGKKQAITVHAEEVTQASNNEQNDYYKVAPKKVILKKVDMFIQIQILTTQVKRPKFIKVQFLMCIVLLIRTLIFLV